MTTIQHELYGFDASASPADRFYGYAARYFINMSRLATFTHPNEVSTTTAPDYAHIEALRAASTSFIAGMKDYFRETHMVDVDSISDQARRDVR
jgi:hypothetical protein